MGGQNSTISGNTMYLSSGTLADWYEGARVGQWLAYATGPAIDPREPVVAMVRQWIDAGAVQPTQQRVDGVLHYRVTRRASGAPMPATRKPLTQTFIASAEGQLFVFIERLTIGGLPMPSNAEIAAVLDWRDRDQVAYRLKRLIEMDLVRVPAVGRFSTRVVTVTEGGARTADARDPARVADRKEGAVA